jgi:hypothetical protein
MAARLNKYPTLPAVKPWSPPGLARGCVMDGSHAGHAHDQWQAADALLALFCRTALLADEAARHLEQGQVDANGRPAWVRFRPIMRDRFLYWPPSCDLSQCEDRPETHSLQKRRRARSRGSGAIPTATACSHGRCRAVPLPIARRRCRLLSAILAQIVDLRQGDLLAAQICLPMLRSRPAGCHSRLGRRASVLLRRTARMPT